MSEDVLRRRPDAVAEPTGAEPDPFPPDPRTGSGVAPPDALVGREEPAERIGELARQQQRAHGRNVVERVRRAYQPPHPSPPVAPVAQRPRSWLRRAIDRLRESLP